MANIRSAIKRISIAKRNRARNLEYKGKIKKLLKQAMASKTAQDVRAAIKWIDKAAGKMIIPKNLAARKKSRLMKLLSVK